MTIFFFITGEGENIQLEFMDLCAGKKWTHVDIFGNKFSCNTTWEVMKCGSYVEVKIAISETCFEGISVYSPLNEKA